MNDLLISYWWKYTLGLSSPVPNIRRNSSKTHQNYQHQKCTDKMYSKKGITDNKQPPAALFTHKKYETKIFYSTL